MPRPQRPRPERADEFPITPNKIDPLHCLYCKREFKVGDRITPVYRITGIGLDSATNMRLPAVADTYEIAHTVCADPQANGITLVVGG
jgi:hypothetical protein